MNALRRVAAAAALALAATTGAVAPAAAKPATTVYYQTESCVAQTALDPREPDFTNWVQIQFTRPDRIGSGRGVYLKAVYVRPGAQVAKTRLRITSHETPRYEKTQGYYNANRQWQQLDTPPESSRRRVTRVNVRTYILSGDDRVVTACSIEIDK